MDTKRVASKIVASGMVPSGTVGFDVWQRLLKRLGLTDLGWQRSDLRRFGLKRLGFACVAIGLSNGLGTIAQAAPLPASTASNGAAASRVPAKIELEPLGESLPDPFAILEQANRIELPVTQPIAAPETPAAAVAPLAVPNIALPLANLSPTSSADPRISRTIGGDSQPLAPALQPKAPAQPSPATLSVTPEELALPYLVEFGKPLPGIVP